jgi:hypothetical protein
MQNKFSYRTITNNSQEEIRVQVNAEIDFLCETYVYKDLICADFGEDLKEFLKEIISFY